MNKKIVGILVCMMLMVMIPGAAGLNYDDVATEEINVICSDEPKETKVISDDEPEPTGIFDRTIIRGVILFPRSTLGGGFRFLALRLHYTTFYLGGVKKGTLMLRSITLPDVPTGYIGNYYITGAFRGNLDAYTT